MGALETAGTNSMQEAIPAIFILVGLFLTVWGVIRHFNALVKADKLIPEIGEKIVIAAASAYPFIKIRDTATVVYRNVKLKTIGVQAADWPDREPKYQEIYPDSEVLIFCIEEVRRPEPEKKIDIGIQGVQKFEEAMDAAGKVLAELVSDEEKKTVEPEDVEPQEELSGSDCPVEPGEGDRQKQEASSHLGYDVQEACNTVTDPPKSKKLIALEAANADRKATAYTRACCILLDIGEGVSLKEAAEMYEFKNVKYMVRSIRKQGLEDPREVAKRVQAEAKAQEPGEPAQCAAADAG